MKKRLNTPEAKELRGIRKERVKRVGKAVGGAALGAAVGTAIGAIAGKTSAAGFEKTKAARNPGRTISVKDLSRRNTETGAMVGGAIGGQLGGIGAGPQRTTAEIKSERTRVKMLRPIVRAQRKNKK